MDSPELTLVLVGNPNTGKSALFNALTGSRQKVANYPGVTVERREGIALLENGQSARVLDLPGTYGLDAKTLDEAVTRDVILGKIEIATPQTVYIAVCDATQLARNLGFVFELKELGIPLVLAVNMMDLARKHGTEIDLRALERELQIPVVATVAVRKEGISELFQRALTLRSQSATLNANWSTNPDAIEKRFLEIDRVLKQSVIQKKPRSNWGNRMDKIVLHPLGGFLVLLLFLTLVFQSVFRWAEAPMDFIEQGIANLSALIAQVLPEGPLRSLLLDGVLAGVGSVLVFLPQIILLFFFIILLEDSGYMARAAFLMDRLMSKVGLHGRAFIPLLSSHACAIPGIMATRTIESRTDRILTILIAPLTTCSARLPVYTLLIAAFIPNREVAGFFNLQGLVLLGLYLCGITAALVVGFVLKKLLFAGDAPVFLLELPSYKVPSLKNLFFGLVERAKVFIQRAGTLILGISIMLWFLASYPKKPADAPPDNPEITYSLAGKLGSALEPLVRPIGFDWHIATALIPGLAAREVMVSALGTVFAVGNGDDVESEKQLTVKLPQVWSLATALSLLAWYVFAPQCLATLAVVRRETNSWKWPAFLFTYMLVLAYAASFLTYRVALAFI